LWELHDTHMNLPQPNGSVTPWASWPTRRFSSVFPEFQAFLPLKCEKRAVATLSAMGGFTTFAYSNRSVALFGGFFWAWRVFLNQKKPKMLQLYQGCTIIIILTPVSTIAVPVNIFIYSFVRSPSFGSKSNVRSEQALRRRYVALELYDSARVRNTWVFYHWIKTPYTQ
jgi:hypothetical protein